MCLCKVNLQASISSLSLDVLATVFTKFPLSSEGELRQGSQSSGTGLDGPAPPAQEDFGIPSNNRAEANYQTSPVNDMDPESPPLTSTSPGCPVHRCSLISSFSRDKTQQPSIASPVLAAGQAKMSKPGNSTRRVLFSGENKHNFCHIPGREAATQGLRSTKARFISRD